MAALAYVLGQLKVYEMPQGGSVSLVMLPIVLIAVRRGLGAGLMAGLLVGIIDYLLGKYPAVHPIQFFLDYPIPYTAIGLAGLIPLARMSGNMMRVVSVCGALLLGVVVRFLAHFTSGVVYFAEYAPEGTPVTTYSFLYNIQYILPEYLITAVVLGILITTAPQLFLLPRGR